MTKESTLCYIEKDGKYLMLHRTVKENDVNKDKWIGVGGHFEHGESPEECLLREVKEETGLDIDLEGDFRQSVEYYPKPNVKKQVVYFLGHARNDHVVRQEEEIGETRWIPLEQAHTWVTFRNDKNLISKAKKILLPE